MAVSHIPSHIPRLVVTVLGENKLLALTIAFGGIHPIVVREVFLPPDEYSFLLVVS